MLKIMIVDDDKWMQDMIRDKIKETADAFLNTQLLVFSSGEAFLEYAKTQEYGEEGDIFFVDIELGNGMTGLEFGRLLRKTYPNRGLVFLTSHTEFALESYEIEADQYILKETMYERLPHIMQKLMRRMGAEKNEYLMLKRQDEPEEKEQKVYFREIITVHKKKMGKYAEYATFHGNFKERISLSELMKKLDSNEFFLADRSNIINLRNVQSIKGNTIYMEEGHELELNQYRIDAAKKKIEAYWREREWNDKSMS